MGVQQGENLHAFLFAVFLNDLESYLEIAGILSLDMTFTALSDFGNTMYHVRHLKLKI